MKNDDFNKKIEEYYSDNPDLYAGNVSIDEIKHAEDKLGLKFSDEYVNFIKNYGGACADCYSIYGIKAMSIMGTSLNDVISNTNFYKLEQQWPGIENWYIISDDGSGNPIGIDPDGVVWLSDHDAGFEQIKLADSFEEFIYKVLTDTLYD